MKTHPFYAPLAGFCMIGIGLCLCRYACTPLIPSLVDHGWVTKAGDGYLSGFNCLGYLLGCVAALSLPARVGVRRLLQWSLVFAVAGQVMSAWNLGFAYLAFARAVTGMAGASLVILTPSLVLPHVTEGCEEGRQWPLLHRGRGGDRDGVTASPDVYGHVRDSRLAF